ncbi:MAG: glutathione S-transferase family protein [Leptolyngbya sp. DLM2.Bin15]|nr:MAG: glutathione S-transferase family protein [Leptolyngbya sp. DLM2.Bin15]
MLTFYYHPLSPFARRVWIALLEKGLAFEPVVVNLNGDQFQPEFLALNPFHHVPVLVDGSLRILESLAILDYLEAQYPTPALSPQSPAAIAKMRMVQMVATNELMSQLPPWVMNSGQPQVTEELQRILIFLSEQLGDAPFFGGDEISLADITVGTVLPLLHRLGLDFTDYPAIAAWHNLIIARPVWQQTNPDEASFSIWKRWVSLKIKRRQQQIARAS